MADSRHDIVPTGEELEQAQRRAARMRRRQQDEKEKRDAFAGSASIAFEELEIGKEIGQGQFGSVFLGTCRGNEVAIKIPKKPHLTRSDFDSFVKEIYIMKSIGHPNVCLLMGACYVENEQTQNDPTAYGTVYIVTELMKGDAEDLILKEEHPLSRRLEWMLEACRALWWMHSMKPPVLHRDLKLSNLLYDIDYHIKLADFGLADFTLPDTQELVSSKPKGTLLYMAPEVVRQDQGLTAKIDVYSMGYVLWEACARKHVFREYQSVLPFVRDVIRGLTRPPLDASWPTELNLLLTSMWHPDPSRRPTMGTVVDKLEKIQQSIARSEALELLRESIRCPDAFSFWQDHFGCALSTTWSKFAPRFYEWLHVDLPADLHQCTDLLARSSDISPPSDNLRRFTALRALLTKHTESTRTGDQSDQAGEIVQARVFGDVVGFFGPLVSPHATGGILDKIVELLKQPYFHGWCPTSDVENYLSVKKDEPGTFLIRFSNTRYGCFTLSMLSKDQVVHHVLSPDQSHGFRFGSKSWKTVPEYIEANRTALHLSEPYPCDKYSFIFQEDANEILGYLGDNRTDTSMTGDDPEVEQMMSALNMS